MTARSARAEVCPVETLVVHLTTDALRDLIADTLAELSPPEPPPEVLDRRGAAAVLGVSTDQIDRLRRDHALPWHRVGDSPRMLRGEILAWVAEQRGAS